MLHRQTDRQTTDRQTIIDANLDWKVKDRSCFRTPCSGQHRIHDDGVDAHAEKTVRTVRIVPTTL